MLLSMVDVPFKMSQNVTCYFWQNIQNRPVPSQMWKRVWLCATHLSTSATYRPNLFHFFSHFPSAYECESQMSQHGDLKPPLMMVSWALEAPMTINGFSINCPVVYQSQPCNKDVARIMSLFQPNLRRFDGC